MNQMLTKGVPQRFLSSLREVPKENGTSYNYEIGFLDL